MRGKGRKGGGDLVKVEQSLLGVNHNGIMGCRGGEYGSELGGLRTRIGGIRNGLGGVERKLRSRHCIIVKGVALIAKIGQGDFILSLQRFLLLETSLKIGNLFECFTFGFCILGFQRLCLLLELRLGLSESCLCFLERRYDIFFRVENLMKVMMSTCLTETGFTHVLDKKTGFLCFLG